MPSQIFLMNAEGHRARVPKAKTNFGIPAQLEQRNPFVGLTSKSIGSAFLGRFVLGEGVAINLVIHALV